MKQQTTTAAISSILEALDSHQARYGYDACSCGKIFRRSVVPYHTLSIPSTPNYRRWQEHLAQEILAQLGESHEL